MSVFISYNSKDEEFVDKLGKELMLHRVPIWRDKWQMRLGDSITNSVQDAMENASFVCLVLSENALNSRWVKREITASLVRELEEKNLKVLPILIDDCQLPLFLRDKLYADFRKDFDSGVKMILNAVADKYNLFAGKITNDQKTTSFGTDVIVYKDSLEINFDIISQDDDADYFILTKVKLTGNENSLECYNEFKRNGDAGEFIKQMIGVCGRTPEITDTKFSIGGKKQGRKSLVIEADKLAFKIDVTSKKVGQDNGKYVVFDLGALFQFYDERLTY